MIEKWAIRLAKWLDHDGIVAEQTENFGPALRLFGLERFRHGQLPIVLAALSGKSVLVVSPTGSGKTLCFQLPAMLRNRVSIVISPLKTLMSEQVSDLLRRKIPATFINSDLSQQEKETRLSMLSRGAFKLLYMAPERFIADVRLGRRSIRQRTDDRTDGLSRRVCLRLPGLLLLPGFLRPRNIRQTLANPTQ